MQQPSSVDADRFIPGVYNYCDRLCQSCAFSSRCAVRDEELGGTGAVGRLTGNRIARLLTEALEDLEDASDPDADADDTALDSSADLYTRIREDPLYVQAHGYATIVDGFIREADGSPWRLHTDGRLAPGWGRPQARSAAGRATPPGGTGHVRTHGAGNPRAAAATTQTPAGDIHGGAPHVESVMTPHATVLWFQVYIPGKVFRALYGLASADFDPVEAQSDANGSAKAALIGVARSREAWRQIVPSDARAVSAITTIVGVLDHLRSDLETRFPRAWAFVRPGFDEAP